MPVFGKLRKVTPRALRNRFDLHWDPDSFGNVSERIARLLGTGKYLVIQTFVCVAWIVYNSITGEGIRFDPFPFILLTLALSLQAAYAAPLILLAQNRQDDRDRAQSERDRQLSQRTQAEAEFLARELASVRLQLADVVTNEDLDRVADRLAAALDQTGSSNGLPPGPPAGVQGADLTKGEPAQDKPPSTGRE